MRDHEAELERVQFADMEADRKRDENDIGGDGAKS
jgi:hypothetical protein